MGANVAYVVEIAVEDGEPQIIPIEKTDHQYRIFRDFRLTPDSLASKDALDEFLRLQMQDGKLSCKGFEVLDVQKWRETAHEFYSGEHIRAEYFGAFRYYVLGRLHTMFVNWHTKRENAKLFAQRHVKGAVQLSPQADNKPTHTE